MSTGIARAKGKKVLLKAGGTTQDIVNTILDVIPEAREQTKGFAKKFTPDRAGMQKLWAWVRQNIEYKEDPLGVQWVREPARLWHDRVGDCKSFTVFIISVLENLGIDYKVRFSNTERPGSKTVNHVYPIAVIGGREIIVDSVYPLFDRQKGYYYAKEYTMADIYRLSGIGTTDQSIELEKYLADVKQVAEGIDDEVLVDDITEMTEGEFARFQQQQQFLAQAEVASSFDEKRRLSLAANAVRTGQIAGIGAVSPNDAVKIQQFLAQTETQTKRAFVPPVVVLPEGISGVLDDIGDAIKNAWKKLVNWLFKKAMPAAAPFFLYAFLKEKVGPKTDRKRERQMGVLNWIQKAGQFDSKQAVLNAAQTGIIKTFGASPRQVLNAAAKGKTIAGNGIGSIALIAVKAITFVIEIISKIVAIFKKKGPDVDKGDAADTDELAAEITVSGDTSNIITTKPGESSGGSGNDALIYGAIAVGVLLLANK